MSINVASGLHDPSPYQTPGELFSHPACKHIISMTTDQQVHLERGPEGFRVIYPDGGSLIKAGNPVKRGEMRKHHFEPRSEEIERIEQHFRLYAEVFSSLQDFYGQHRHSWQNIRPQDAIWQDITGYPELPYSTIYCPLREHINFFARFGAVTHHGSYSAYGPAKLMYQGAEGGGILQPTDSWLVLEYPATRHQVVYKVVALTRLTEQSQQQADSDRGFGSVGFVERPACLVVYGRPPADWRSGPQHVVPLSAI